jgi:hypothetical protein
MIALLSQLFTLRTLTGTEEDFPTLQKEKAENPVKSRQNNLY